MSFEQLRPDRFNEKCGVTAVHGVNKASEYAYFMQHALQHRGDFSAGIASYDGRRTRIHRGFGGVDQVFNTQKILWLDGMNASGHNRYPTSGGNGPENTQPLGHPKSKLILGHNGNLASVRALQQDLEQRGIPFDRLNDSGLIHAAANERMLRGMSVEEAIHDIYPLLTGVFCLTGLAKDKVVVVRDPYGIRPLSMGTVGTQGTIFASERCAFDSVGGKFTREVNPGEMVVVSDTGLKSYDLADGKGQLKIDAFEYVYFAKPDSTIEGVNVALARDRMGRTLAREHPRDVDIVIPVPQSGIYAALGYAKEIVRDYTEGLIKNQYVGRTFLQHASREQKVQMKLNAIEEIVRNKRIAVIDDSIVRGTTSPLIIQMLRDKGAKEVHMLISSPPAEFPDYYGIDTPDQTQLASFGRSVEDVRQMINADTLGFLSIEGLIESIGLRRDQLNLSPFDGIYPCDILERAQEVKYRTAA